MTTMIPIQPPSSTDVMADLESRVTALESAQYDDDLPVDMFRVFVELPLATDTCTISPHLYPVCGPNTICGQDLMV